MRYNDSGDEVRELQKELMSRGYALSRYGADGHLGEETWDAIQQFVEDENMEWCPRIPQSALERMKEPKTPLVIANSTELPSTLLDVPVFDLRKEQTNPPSKSNKFKLRAGRVVVRNPKTVTGITVHQTAVRYGVRDYQVQDAGWSVKLALARRSLDVACHVMAFCDGFIAWPNELSWYIHHGNGFNRTDLGIEIDGNYPGLVGGSTWNGKKPTPVTDSLVKAARAGIELLVREGRRLGMPIQYIHAHRQSSKSRRSDPGEELWKKVVLDFAVDKLGLIPEQSKTLGSGRPVPKQWDSNGVGDY